MSDRRPYKVFSQPMAAYLADTRGFPLLRKYYSDVYNSEVYEFTFSYDILQAGEDYKKLSKGN